MKQDSVLLEVNKEDERYKKNKDQSLNACSLGEFAEILDLVLNDKDKIQSLNQIYSCYLDCKVEDIVSSKKSFSDVEKNILLYTIDTQKKFKKEEIFTSKDLKSYK